MGAGRIAAASLVGVLVLVILLPLSAALGILGDIFASIAAGCVAGSMVRSPEGGALASCFIAPICAGIVAIFIAAVGFATVGPLFGLYAGGVTFIPLLIAFIPIWFCSLLGGVAGGILNSEPSEEGLRIGPRLREPAGPVILEREDVRTVTTDAVPEVEEPSIDFRICPNCNTKAPGDAAFCPECGAHIAE
ncbi:MAG: zinc ribbon domain-containing protein [Candidatus Hodarchaeota archaeon]